MKEDDDLQWKTRPTLGELCDRLTILSLRRVKDTDGDRKDLHKTTDDIIDDIGNYLGDEYARLMESACFLAAINAQIWLLKDEMSGLDPESKAYSSRLTLAHQLNGYRNITKNSLSQAGGASQAQHLSNVSTDGLDL